MAPSRRDVVSNGSLVTTLSRCFSGVPHCANLLNSYPNVPGGTDTVSRLVTGCRGSRREGWWAWGVSLGVLEVVWGWGSNLYDVVLGGAVCLLFGEAWLLSDKSLDCVPTRFQS